MPSPMSVMTPTSSLNTGTSNFSIFCFSSSVISWLLIPISSPVAFSRPAGVPVMPAAGGGEFVAHFQKTAADAAIGDVVAVANDRAAKDFGVDAEVDPDVARGLLAEHPGQ